ncbi:hypothetical protein RB195_003504 [Necator americanus]|uniref:DUF4440 domain-containing protein n=1 Tax=Necator americanus TaxID=51031 RepID=A0ABR1DP63_NECAM
MSARYGPSRLIVGYSCACTVNNNDLWGDHNSAMIHGKTTTAHHNIVMCSEEEAKSIIKPIFEKYCTAVDNQQWDEIAQFYDLNTVVVQTGKKCIYGREAVKKEFLEFEMLMGKTTIEVSGETYKMTPGFIFLNADYETNTEKMGVVRGNLLQIWKKSDNTYVIYHEEFSVE